MGLAEKMGAEREAKLPSQIVGFAEPVGVVERRVGEELSFAGQKTCQVASRLRIRAHAGPGVAAEAGMEIGAEEEDQDGVLVFRCVHVVVKLAGW